MIPANDNRANRNEAYFIVCVILAMVAVIAAFFAVGHKQTADAMALTTPQERSEVLFRSCLDGMYFRAERGPGCARMAKQLKTEMDQEAANHAR